MYPYNYIHIRAFYRIKYFYSIVICIVKYNLTPLWIKLKIRFWPFVFIGVLQLLLIFFCNQRLDKIAEQCDDNNMMHIL